MFFKMPFQSLPCPKRPDTTGMRTDKLLHSSVDEEEVINELLVSPAVCPTERADCLSLIGLQVLEKMQAIFIAITGECLAAHAASHGDHFALLVLRGCIKFGLDDDGRASLRVMRR